MLDEYTILVEKLIQLYGPILLVLTTIFSADHHLEAMLHSFYMFPDTQVILLTMTSCMYYHWH